MGIDSYEIAVSLPSLILQYLGENSGGGGPGGMSDILDEIGTSTEDNDVQVDELSDDALLGALVSRILHDAKRLNIEYVDPEKNAPTRVRMRVDGVPRHEPSA